MFPELSSFLFGIHGGGCCAVVGGGGLKKVTAVEEGWTLFKHEKKG